MILEASEEKRTVKYPNEYSTIEDIMRDAHAEGLLLLTVKGKEVFPNVYGKALKPQVNHVEVLKVKILKKITEASSTLKPVLSRAKLNRAVRGDNYPEEFKQAVEQLVAERKISEQKLWTKASHPVLEYHL